MSPTILASKINSLNKIFDYKNKDNIIYSIKYRYQHFDIENKQIRDILPNDEMHNIQIGDYSILRLNPLKTKNKLRPHILKMKNGDVKLMIPFVRIFNLHKE